MNMKPALIILLVLGIGAASSSEGPAPLNSYEKEQLLGFAGSRANTHLNTLPPQIAKMCADSEGRFAAAGATWEATDFISDASLPRSRLIWHATSGTRTLVHYETGGRAHTSRLLLVETKPKLEILVSARTWPLTSPNELRHVLGKGEVFIDRP
jgi:hypothetical protein